MQHTVHNLPLDHHNHNILQMVEQSSIVAIELNDAHCCVLLSEAYSRILASNDTTPINLDPKPFAFHSLGEDAQLVSRQVKEAESDTATSTEEVAAVKGTMGRVLSTWEAYSKNLPPLQTWLAQESQSPIQSSGTEVQVRL